MLKTIGTILIVLSASGVGYEKSVQYRKKYEYRKELKKILCQLKADIAYGKTPLIEAFEGVSKRTYDPFLTELTTLIENLNQKEGRSFSQIWEAFTKALSVKVCFSKEEEMDFMKLGNSLGSLDAEQTIGAIDFYLEQLQYEMEEQRTKLPGRVKLSCCLGVVTGIFTAIIFT